VKRDLVYVLTELRDRFDDMASREKEKEYQAYKEGNGDEASNHHSKASAFNYACWCVEKQLEEVRSEK